MTTIKVGDHELPAEECDQCDGTGIAGTRQSGTITRFISDDGERHNPPLVEDVTAQPGDRCLSCGGHGLLVSMTKSSPIRGQSIH